ncbi:hypothetical protein [Phytohabitans kaempferiae]|uniref:DUF3040 domain-containing protein n=1 Tax=Phytohabitans kaempferiae TaxID=1620943 RepID=A0ABV6MBS5_9ACTN
MNHLDDRIRRGTHADRRRRIGGWLLMVVAFGVLAVAVASGRGLALAAGLILAAAAAHLLGAAGDRPRG